MQAYAYCEDAMTPRTIIVAKDVDEFVEEQVRAGHYKDASDVVNDALRMKQEQERKTLRLHEEIKKGFDSGTYEGDPFEEIFAELANGGDLS